MANEAGFEARDQRFLSGMIEAMPCPAAAFDASGRILYANQAAATTLQTAKIQQLMSAVVRSKWQAKQRPDSKVLRQNERAIQELRRLGIELRICYAASQCTVVCWPLPGKGVNCWACCCAFSGQQTRGAIDRKLPSVLTAINFLESELLLAVAALLSGLDTGEGSAPPSLQAARALAPGAQQPHGSCYPGAHVTRASQGARAESNPERDLRAALELIRSVATGLGMLSQELQELQSGQAASASALQPVCSCGAGRESCYSDACFSGWGVRAPGDVHAPPR